MHKLQNALSVLLVPMLAQTNRLATLVLPANTARQELPRATLLLLATIVVVVPADTPLARLAHTAMLALALALTVLRASTRHQKHLLPVPTVWQVPTKAPIVALRAVRSVVMVPILQQVPQAVLSALLDLAVLQALLAPRLVAQVPTRLLAPPNALAALPAGIKAVQDNLRVSSALQVHIRKAMVPKAALIVLLAPAQARVPRLAPSARQVHTPIKLVHHPAVPAKQVLIALVAPLDVPRAKLEHGPLLARPVNAMIVA